MNHVRAQAKNLNHFGFILFVFIILNTLSVFAGPANTTYQAKIIKPDGLPLEAANVNFKFTILNPAGTCILYAETYSAVNMSGAGGLISFALGSGVKTYPVSATTFEQVFSNITPSLSCDAGGPPSYSPLVADARKIVMQFHDGSGWQTLPAMNVNAVPYAMYANEAQKISGLPSCNLGEALFYNGTNFSCVAAGGSTVTSSTITAALGYTPADNAAIANITTNVSSVSTTLFSVSSTVSTLTNTVAASFSSITSSQWLTSGTTINYSSGYVGIGVTAPSEKLDVSGAIRATGYITTFAANSNSMDYYAGNARFYSMGPDASTRGGFLFRTMASDGSLGLIPMAIASGGSVGIGTTAPEFKLSIDGDGGILAKGTYGTGATLTTSGAGARLIWYPRKAAFRAGYVTGTQWDNANIGDNSIAMGWNNTAGGTNAVVMGFGNTVNAVNGVGIGSGNSVMNSSAVAIGSSNVAFGDSSTAIGVGTRSNGVLSTSLGYTTTADSYSQITTGAYNMPKGSENTASWVETDPLFVVGNGTGAGASRSNAVMILKNGNVGIGTSAPSAKLHIAAGTSSTVAFKLTSGTLLATPASGAVEYDGFNLYYTDGANMRRTLATTDTSGVTSSAISSALGYTPADSSVVTSLAATVSGISESQWITSGTTINYANNVGIGTTTPGAKLEVAGQVKITGGTPGAGKVLTSDAAGLATWETPAVGGDFKADGSVSMTGTFKASAGTTALPSIAFSGDPNTGFSNEYNNDAILVSLGGSPKVQFYSNYLTRGGGNTGNWALKTDGVGNTAASPAYTFWGDYDTGVFHAADNQIGLATNANERIRIDASGNVGVGTNAPQMKLHVASGPVLIGANIGGYSTEGLIVNTSSQRSDISFMHSTTGVTQTSDGFNMALVFNNVDFDLRENGYMRFLTSGTEQVRITSTGNFGIGTTGPTAKLHVRQLASESPFSVDKSDGTNIMNVDWAGRITMDTNVNSTVPMLTVGNGNFGGRLLVLNGKSGNTNNLLEAKHNSTDKFVVTYTGATGIGTSTPTTALHIVTSGAGTARGLRINSTGTGNGIFAEAQFASDAREFRIGVGGASETTYSVPGKFYLFDNNANAMRMVVDSGGNVGIGTTTPAYKFSLYEGAGSVVANVESGNNGSAAYTRTTGKTSGGVTRTVGTGLNISDSNGNFELYDFTAGASRLYVNAAGNVGIGITSPTYRLDVAGSALIRGGAAHAVPAPTYGGTFFSFDGATNTAGLWSTNATTSQFAFYTKTDNTDSGTERLRIANTGNVGIATSSPAYKLDVNGDIRITGTPYRNGGDSAWIVPSDARLKDVVSTYDRGLREIANIDTIIFNYKKDNPKQIDASVRYTGVLAQQVQQQIPEAVKVEKDGYLSLNTTPIFWAMVNAIKELYYDVLGIKAENARLKAQSIEQARKIQSLESENAAVKARLERIEKALEKTK